MKIVWECLLILLIRVSSYRCTNSQTSNLDTLVPTFRILRGTLLDIFGRTSQLPNNLRLAKEINILQTKINDDVPFPCPLNNTRSDVRPTSVHSLRPGDIDVIGCIGDSLFAGNGILATNVFQIAIQNRGISPAIGGQETWRQYVTLPNILKEFNSYLIGYSSTDSYVNQNASQFNVAEAFAISSDTPFMAHELIRRMKGDPRVNILTDWKLITILIGANDFCSEVCYEKNPESILEKHRKDLIKVLRILRENLPRTLVSIVLAPDLRVLANTTTSNRPFVCYVTRNFLCPCIFGLQFRNLRKKIEQLNVEWQNIEIEVASKLEFDRDDFSVVVQPFIIGYKLKTDAKGLTDYSQLSQDCFHLSQKESARAALSLWNNMLEPVGKKTMAPWELFNFKCPTANQPYIFTRRNSR